MRGNLLLQQRVPGRALADAKGCCNQAKEERFGKIIKNIKHQVREGRNDARVSKEMRLINASFAGLNAVVRSLIAEGVNVDYRSPRGEDAQLYMIQVC